MSSTGFTCTLDEFKLQAAKLAKRAESGSYTAEALELGMRSLRLYYLNLVGIKADIAIAFSYLEYANRKYIAAALDSL